MRASLGSRQVGVVHVVERLAYHSGRPPVWIRMTAAGFVTGLCALVAPEVIGVGYDTVELTLLREMAFSALLLVAVVKLAGTIACISLGLPGGLIGPTLVVGAATGGALGVVGHAMMPEMSSSGGFYAMLGMGAMMGAALQTALMAFLELTANSNSILPAILAIVTATLTTRVVLKKNSVFIGMLESRALEYRHDPVAIALSRTGVEAIMDRCFVKLPARVTSTALSSMDKHKKGWILITENDQATGVIAGESLAAWATTLSDDDGREQEPTLFDLEKAHSEFATVGRHATPAEAIERTERTGSNVALVTKSDQAVAGGVLGLLTRDRIEASVRYRH